MIIGYGI